MKSRITAFAGALAVLLSAFCPVRSGAQVLGQTTLYAPDVKPTGAISFGRVLLNAGPNTIEIELTGKAPASIGYYVGIDGFVLKP